MIRVLNIISDTNIGGAGRVIMNYLKYSDRADFETHVADPRGSALKGPLSELGATVHEVDGIADRSLDIGALGTLKELIRRVDPDIVHTHGSLTGRVAGRQCKKAVIFTRHSAFPVKPYMKKGPGRWLNKFINEHYADAIIAVSPATAENLTDGGVSRDRIEIMMNGVEPVRRLSPEERAAFRTRWGVAPTDFVMGIVARIEDYKGHTDILEAMAKLLPKRPELKLLIAGTGAYEEQVKKRAKDLGLEDRVVFLGFQDDVAPVLSVLDVQLNASWGTEASSMAMLEGFSAGVPVIASDYGGNPYQVRDGVSGLIYRTRDVAGLADRIDKLAGDPALRERLGLGARREYENRFTGEIFAGRIEEIYRKTLEARDGK